MKFDLYGFLFCLVFGGGLVGLICNRLSILDKGGALSFTIGTIIMYSWINHGSDIKEFLNGFNFKTPSQKRKDEERLQERIRGKVKKAIEKSFFDDVPINSLKRTPLENFTNFREHLLPELQNMCKVNHSRRGYETGEDGELFIRSQFDFSFSFELKNYRLYYSTFDDSLLVTKKGDFKAGAIVFVQGEYSGIDWIKINIIDQKGKWL